MPVSAGCRSLLLVTIAVGATARWDDSGFFDWFADELRETKDHPLVFNGTVPAYVRGAFVQTGPGRFGFGKDKFTHMMDGYSKTNTIHFVDGQANYTTQFLPSAFLNQSIQRNGIERGMSVGPVDPPQHWGPTIIMGPNDNNYIKMRTIGGQRVLMGDSMTVSFVQDDFVSMLHNVRPQKVAKFVPGISWNDTSTPNGDMCMLGTMAHAAEDPATGVLTCTMGCFGQLPGMGGNYHVLFEISPEAPDVRKVVAKLPLPRDRHPSYMHSMSMTPRFVVMIAEPLYLSMVSILQGKPLGRGGLRTTDESTLFQINHVLQVVSRVDGSVRTLEADGFIFGHVINSWEEGDDILIDLTWYDAGNATTLGWFNRWFLEYMKDEAIRESWPRASVMRYRLGADGSVANWLLFEQEQALNDFETPKINEARNGLPYCVAYFMQFHAYDYSNETSMQGVPESGPFGAVGIAKRNLCTGQIQGFYRPNEYPSEVQFIADPNGKDEDDGVLLSMVFNANSNSSYFQILDASTLERVAMAPLPIKTPFLIHSSFFSTE